MYPYYYKIIFVNVIKCLKCFPSFHFSSLSLLSSCTTSAAPSPPPALTVISHSCSPCPSPLVILPFTMASSFFLLARRHLTPHVPFTSGPQHSPHSKAKWGSPRVFSWGRQDLQLSDMGIFFYYDNTYVTKPLGSRSCLERHDEGLLKKRGGTRNAAYIDIAILARQMSRVTLLIISPLTIASPHP